MMEQVGVLDVNWLASSNLFEYVLKNGDKILVTQDEFHRIFSSGIELESVKDKVYAPIFSSDGGEVVAWELIGDKQYTWDDLANLSDNMKRCGSKSSLEMYRNKDGFFEENNLNDDTAQYYVEEFEKHEYENDEKIIILHHGNGENYFFKEDDIQEIFKSDLIK